MSGSSLPTSCVRLEGIPTERLVALYRTLEEFRHLLYRAQLVDALESDRLCELDEQIGAFGDILAAVVGLPPQNS